MLTKSTIENWRGLIKPKKIEIEKETLTGFYGKFVAKPLERGYGITIGNSLRRILLSSLRGSAITSVKINGVLHEYTSIADVVEDVADIILNLKEVRFELYTEDPKVINISKKGKGVVTAADFEIDNNIKVLNPDQHICTLSKGANFDIECVVRWGRGYVVAEENKHESDPVGAIYIDSLFSPVRKVNYTVTNARVGQRTDYDKLTLEVWTDGSVSPDYAVAYASKILKDQLSVFINFEEEVEPSIESSAQMNENPFLDRGVGELELSVRSANCLKNANIKTIRELVSKSEHEMLRTKNFGRKSLTEIKEILKIMGLHLGMKVDSIMSSSITSEEVAASEEDDSGEVKH